MKIIVVISQKRRLLISMNVLPPVWLTRALGLKVFSAFQAIA